MKTLNVYTPTGYAKFRGIYQTYVFEITESVLYIYRIDPSTNQEVLWAAYREWSHVEMEEDR